MEYKKQLELEIEEKQKKIDSLNSFAEKSAEEILAHIKERRDLINKKTLEIQAMDKELKGMVDEYSAYVALLKAKNIE